MILVDAQEISMSRPGRPLFRDLSIALHSGDRIGIVGLNGCGKSTLLSVLTGAEVPESGVVRFGRDVRISAMSQRDLLPAGSVAEVLGSAWQGRAIADRLGLRDALECNTDQLSGGQRKRVALALALVAECDLLVLDEPTNHLDIEATLWLEDHLKGLTCGLLLVTHDRHLLDAVTTRILELDRGSAWVHEGGYATYLGARARREEHAERAESVRRNLARSELAWLRRGAPARTSKPKARIDRALEIVNGRPQPPARTGTLPLDYVTPRLGDVVIELRQATLGYGNHEVLEAVSISIEPGARLGLVGGNGAGKSTLMHALAGKVPLLSGEREVGTTVRIGYFDQLGASLDADSRVREVVAGPHRVPDHVDAALMESFWFDSDAQFAPVRLLSGGERRRLQLLMVLAQRPNVLLLDEPSNDLDTDTLRSLEDFCEDFGGSVVVVSHDRAVMERIVSDVVVVDDGKLTPQPGGFGSYLASRLEHRRQRTLAHRPHGRSERPQVNPDAPKGPSPSTLRHRLRAVNTELTRLNGERDELAAELQTIREVSDLERCARELSAVETAREKLEEEWLELAEAAESRGLDLGDF